MEKLNSIQYIRAISACLVVVSHLWGINGSIGKPLGFDFIGGYGVDIFFVISGFIMCYTVRDVFDNPRKEALSFLLKRIMRIYPVYIIIAAPAIIFFVLNAMQSGEGVSLYMIIGNFLLLPTFNQDPSYHMYFFVAWSLCYEMMFYVIFAIAMSFSKNKIQLISAMSIILIGGVCLVNTFRLQGDMLGWVNFTYMIGDTLVINFAMGCLAYVIYRNFKWISFSPALSFALIFVILCIGVINVQHQAHRILSSGFPALLIVLITIYTKPILDNTFYKISGVALYLGNASYSIYLIHWYFVYILQDIYSMTPISKDVTGFLLSIFAIVCGCIFYSVIEKPLNGIIHGRFYKRVPA